MAAALGQELKDSQVHGMMEYAAEHVLGWGSGAGRGRGLQGRLSPEEFRRLLDHLRVE